MDHFQVWIYYQGLILLKITAVFDTVDHVLDAGFHHSVLTWFSSSLGFLPLPCYSWRPSGLCSWASSSTRSLGEL